MNAKPRKPKVPYLVDSKKVPTSQGAVKFRIVRPARALGSYNE
jgi:hypothetical protein